MKSSKEKWPSSWNSRPNSPSNIQQLREVQAQTERLVGRLASVTLEGFKDVNVKINALVDSQIRTDENVSRTDETLRNLIAVVDRYFSEGRNGR